MSLKDDLNNLISRLEYMREYDTPEALERQLALARKEASILRQENANQQRLIQELQLEIARLGVELGKALKRADS